MPFQLLHSLPQEILTEVLRYAAVSPGGGLPTAALNVALCDKALHNRVALSSIFGRTAPWTDNSGLVNPKSFTHPGLWTGIFTDLFSSSAVRRRSFNPTTTGFALQLVSYCQALSFLRRCMHMGYQAAFTTLDPARLDSCLEIIHLMLLECDGKNTCHLDWANAHWYCMHWIGYRLYPRDGNNYHAEWPRDDRSVAYALSNLWLLTTADIIHMEPRPLAIKVQDIIFRFVFCSWKYPSTFAPLHRYRLPLGGVEATSNGPSSMDPFSFGNVMRFPLYRSSNSSSPRLNTSPSQVGYYGTKLELTPPLVTTSAKKLFFARQEKFPFGIPPIIAANREALLERRRASVETATTANPALLALYNLVQSNGLITVRQMITHGTLPPHIATMPGIQDAVEDIGSITGVYGDDPALATEATAVDMEDWNSRRETQLPLRGGWYEDGNDPNNRRWFKTRDPTQGPLPPLLQRLQDFGLPYEIKNLSEVHDAHFWRLRLCGDPFDQQTSLSKVLTPQERRTLENASLTGSLARLRPGRTWRPGLMRGLFQGRMGIPNEHWLLNGFHEDHVQLAPIGQDIQWNLRVVFLQFFGRFEEHHLMQPCPHASGQKNALADPKAMDPVKVPFTLDSRSIPRRVDSAGQDVPLETFATSIRPSDYLLVDEGGMNAFLPQGFRYNVASDYRTGNSRATFAWGPPGAPSSERTAKYETFQPDQPSEHFAESCPRCLEREDYLANIKSMQLDKDSAELAQKVFASFGMDEETSSHCPSRVEPCDGILDTVITGETDTKHGQAWNPYHFLGRVRKWDGLVCFLRIPKNYNAGLMTQLIYGYWESDFNFVGSWRLVPADRVFDGAWIAPPVYDAAGGLNGSGLMGRGGAGVLGDGLRYLWEGPYSMSRVIEDEKS